MVRTLAITVGSFVILALFVRWEPLPTTHRDAVYAVLHDLQIGAQSVQITQQWPNALPFYAYGDAVVPYQATVNVRLLSGVDIKGSLVCHSAPHACRLTLPALALYSVAVPDIVDGRTNVFIRRMHEFWLNLIDF